MEKRTNKLKSIIAEANKTNNVWSLDEDGLFVYNSVNNHEGNDISMEILPDGRYNVCMTGYSDKYCKNSSVRYLSTILNDLYFSPEVEQDFNSSYIIEDEANEFEKGVDRLLKDLL